MVRIYTREENIPKEYIEAGDWLEWEYAVIPNTYKDIKKARAIALQLCHADYRKFKTKNGHVFYITYYD